eukprot:6914173-Pyramimonas_sp.AAC.1
MTSVMIGPPTPIVFPSPLCVRCLSAAGTRAVFSAACAVARGVPVQDASYSSPSLDVFRSSVVRKLMVIL